MPTNPPERAFALRLMLAFEARGMSQADLARKMAVKQSVICNLMQGRVHPSYETLIGLADSLGVSTDYLCGRRQT